MGRAKFLPIHVDKQIHMQSQEQLKGLHILTAILQYVPNYIAHRASSCWFSLSVALL